jgi:ubiquinone/menaquinone biosynthesis C-methylase UbiE
MPRGNSSLPRGKVWPESQYPCAFSDIDGRAEENSMNESASEVQILACGTGILAREACAMVGKGGTVLGLDTNAGVLAVAKKLEPNIQWHLGIAEALPFSGNSFDAVISQFGLMFFTDRVKAVRDGSISQHQNDG